MAAGIRFPSKHRRGGLGLLYIVLAGLGTMPLLMAEEVPGVHPTDQSAVPSATQPSMIHRREGHVPKGIEARRLGDPDVPTHPWRMHGLLVHAQDDWRVRWVNGRMTGTAVGFARPVQPAEGEERSAAVESLAFFPETLESLHEQYVLESPTFAKVFPSAASLREGFATDLALFDAIVELPEEARDAPLDSPRRALRWVRDRGRVAGDLRLHGTGVTAHIRLVWSGWPENQGIWTARGAVFDAAGTYRGTLIIRAEDLDRSHEEAFVALCSDIVSRLAFND